MMYHPELTQNTYWYPSTCDIFLKSLRRYIVKLEPLAREDRTKINNAIDKSKELIKLIEGKLSEGGDEIVIPFLGKDLAMIHTLVAKYSSYKNQLLRESTLIPEALEPDKEELETVRQVMQTLEQCKIPRGEVVSVEFYGEDEKKEENVGSQIINIGTLNNMNGQFAGFNSGSISQTQSLDVVKILNSLSEIITKEAPEEIKQEAIADIVTLNAQIAGGKPDKSIMEKAFKKLTDLLKGGLVYGAAFTQIYQTVIQPHLAEIQTFIHSIAH